MRVLPFFKPKKGWHVAGTNLESDSGGGDMSALVNKTDLTPIILTGTTNTSGSTITSGTWFYLNGNPCIAKVDIASDATFTEGTNYEENTIGSALTELNSKIDNNIKIKSFAYSYTSPTVAETTYTIQDGKATVFGLPSNADINGICLLVVGGSSSMCYNMTLMYRQNNDIVSFKPTANNSQYVDFYGVVLYTL